MNRREKQTTGRRKEEGKKNSNYERNIFLEDNNEL
jgi:hypothetical protein